MNWFHVDDETLAGDDALMVSAIGLTTVWTSGGFRRVKLKPSITKWCEENLAPNSWTLRYTRNTNALVVEFTDEVSMVHFRLRWA